VDGACSTHGDDGNACKISFGKPEGRDYLGGLGADKRIILKYIPNSGFIWLRVGSSDELL
jgi:hypothetical protein